MDTAKPLIKEKSKFRKKLEGFRVPFATVMFLLCIAYVFLIVFPVYWGLSMSLKTERDAYTNIYGLPRSFDFANYYLAFTQLYVDVTPYRYFLPRLFLNSFIFAFGNVTLSSVSTCFCAYLFNKYKCKFGTFLYNLYLVMLVIPIVGSTGAQLAFRQALGLYDNLIGSLYMNIGFNTGNLLLYYAAFSGVSSEYIDAATIDGAGHWQILLRIMFPMIRVPFLLLYIQAFIPQWNDFMGPLVNLPSFPTAAVALYRFQIMSNNETSHITVRMAGSMVVCMPCLILFLAFKNQMMGNLTLGGIKG